MKSSKNIPAFPFEYEAQSGMSMRDYFAAKAMHGMCDSERWPDGKDMPYMARLSYEMADAMERDK